MQVGADIDGEASADISGTTVSLSDDGSILAIGAANNDGNGINSGQIRVYQNNGGSWLQIGSDIDGEAAGDNLGWSVSLSSDGTILASGAPNNDGTGEDIDCGHARVYENISNVWTQVGTDIDGEGAVDLFGTTVSLSADGSIIAIGGYKNDGSFTDAGHARIYENISGVWTQIGEDINGEAETDYFGGSLSLNSAGNIVAISAILNDGNGTDAGNVRVFENISGVWTQVGANIEAEAAGDMSGWSVSLSDNSILAISGIYNDGDDASNSHRGHVRVWENTTIGINEYSLNQDISFYPNPTNGIINVNAEDIKNIEIIDLQGKQIYSGYDNHINLSQNAKGIYIIKVTTDLGVSVDKIILE